MSATAGLTELDRALLAAVVGPAQGLAQPSWAAAAAVLNADDGLQRFAGERQDLIGLLHRTARAAGADGDLVALLAGGHRRIWAANQLVLADLRPGFASLLHHGVPFLATGDLAIVGWLDDVGARPLRRLSVCVPAPHLHQARTALLRADWSAGPRSSNGYVADARAHAFIAPGGVRLELIRCEPRDWQTLQGDAHTVHLPGAPPLPVSGRGALLAELISDPTGWLPRPRLLRLADTALLLSRATPADCRVGIAHLMADRQISALQARTMTMSKLVPGSVPAEAQRVISAQQPSRTDRLARQLDTVAPSLAHHLRQTADAGPRQVLRALPASLVISWDLTSAWQIPRAAGTQVRRRLRRRS